MDVVAALAFSWITQSGRCWSARSQVTGRVSLQVFIETPLTQVGRVCFITFINHYRRPLPIIEGLFAPLFVTTKQRF